MASKTSCKQKKFTLISQHTETGEQKSFYRWCRAFGVVYTNTTKPQSFMGVEDSPTKRNGLTASTPAMIGATHNIRAAAARSVQRRQRLNSPLPAPPSPLRETMFASPDVAKPDLRKAIRKIRAKQLERAKQDAMMDSPSALGAMDFLESPVMDTYDPEDELDDRKSLWKSVSESRFDRSNVSKRFVPTSHDRFAPPLSDGMLDLEFVKVPRLGQKISKLLDRSLPSQKSFQHQRYRVQSHDSQEEPPVEENLFSPGDLVEIQDLTRQVKYNGLRGKILKFVRKDRLYVLELKSGEHLALREEKLVEATTKKHRIWKGPRYAPKPKRVRPTIDRGYGIKRKDSLEWLRALRLVGKTLDAGVYGDAHYVS